MAVRAARFAALLFVALSLAPSVAHVLELPNKIGLPREAYFTVQQIYRGWALLGIIVIAALAATLVLTVMERKRPRRFALSLAALLALAGAQAIFWAFTQPANRATDNWTVVPPDWVAQRDRWEYSHAAAAGLDVAAMILLLLSVTARERDAAPAAAAIAGGAVPQRVPDPVRRALDADAGVWPRPLPARPLSQAQPAAGGPSPRRARMRASRLSRTAR